MRSFLYRVATDQVRGFPVCVLKAFLRGVSIVYGAIVTVLSAWSPRRRLSMPVISVGNITLGGTGKTPLVIVIARFLKEEGRRPAVVTRGYALSRPGGGPSGKTADEPVMLAQLLTDVPVIINADRRAGAREALSSGADTVILDDGFQQWGIAKDLDIVAIDATRPFGNGCCVPRGILREPLAALRRADVFVMTKVNLASGTASTRAFLEKINPRATVVEAHHVLSGFYQAGAPGILQPVEAVRGHRAATVCGIGDPASFARLVAGSGITIGRAFEFPDHHEYSQDDITRIAQVCAREGITVILTTDKDAVRLGRCDLAVLGRPVYIGRLAMVVTGGKELLYDRLRKLYSA